MINRGEHAVGDGHPAEYRRLRDGSQLGSPRKNPTAFAHGASVATLVRDQLVATPGAVIVRYENSDAPFTSDNEQGVTHHD